MEELSFYKGKRVFVTGHTGFKGSFLTEILLELGAEVYGYALAPETDPNAFTLLALDKRLGKRSVTGDIRDLSALWQAFQKADPEIVFHLAAQPIVRRSYEEPALTYETNVMGTVNVLECIRRSERVSAFLNVTTDKVYENRETNEPFREDDRLCGFDPYSNSKSCSELVTQSYRQSFFAGKNVAVSTARAGNVIGGGDYSRDRLVPDGVRAAKSGNVFLLRNPRSIRPYQHVFEPLFAYLTIAKATVLDKSLAGSYNVGPDACDCLTTEEMAKHFVSAWGENVKYEAAAKSEGPHEAGLLRLDNTKLKETFSITPVWDARTAIEKTVEWEKADDKLAVTRKQIEEYKKDAGSARKE